MEIKANELTINEIDSIKTTIITATAENRKDILKAFNDFELQTELKARGAICSTNAFYKAENESLKARNEKLEQDYTELLKLMNLNHKGE